MISGRGFAEQCRWVLCPRYPDLKTFVYQFSSNGDWVFVNGDYIHEFVKRIPVVSTKKYTIIVHNTDRPFGIRELQSLLKYAQRIYAINTTIQHPMLTTIPIGFVDSHVSLLPKSPVDSESRTIEIYMNFKDITNLEVRRVCRNTFRDVTHVVQKDNVPVSEYYEDLCKSKFVLCPEGTGIDTHRVYESLLCGATPVVLRNSLSHLYEKLPVCIVDAWTDPFYVPEGKTFSTDVTSYLQSM